MSQAPYSAVMSAGATYEGDMNFEGRVRVDGRFKGRITSDDLLEVGDEGRIDGEVDVARAIISGAVTGRLRVREHLRLLPGARVEGLLDAGVVEIQPGARIKGEVRIAGEALP